MKKTLVPFLILLLAFWMAAIFWLVPSVEKDIGEAARQALEGSDGRFKGIEVTASGQAVRLSGHVESESLKLEAQKRIAEQAKAPLSWRFKLGSSLTPQTEIINEIIVSAPPAPVIPPVPQPPKPPGWALLSVTGRRATLLGEAATQEEHDTMLSAVAAKWPEALKADQFQVSLSRGPAPTDLHVSSLAALPAPPSTLGMLAVARLGREWSQLGDLKLPEEALRAKLESAEIPWLPAAPVVAESRAFHDVEWGKLAIPYLTMSGQGDTIELRGAVPTNDMRSLITEDAVKFYEGKTVKSDIKLADAMRSDIDPSPTLAEWPEFSNTETTGILAFALVGKSWKRISARSTPSQWSLLIPEGFTAAPALADLAMLSESLKHRLKTAPPPAHLTAPYVALSALGSKVDVKGEVASEEIKTQLASEIAKAFSGLLVTMDLRVSNRVIPVTEISQTIETIPDPPTEKGGGLMAFAPLGRPWRLLSADPSVADQLRAPWVGLVENGFDTLLAQEDLTELARHFRKTGAPGTVADALPLAHVSLAIYQGGVHLSGEVSSMAEKREILAAAKAQWPDVDRHDEIRPSGAVQPAGNWTQAFAKAPDMPEAGKNVLGLLVAGRTWSEHTIEKLPVDVDSLSTTPLFPGEEERVLAMGDFGAWIAEMNQGAKPAPKPLVVAEAATTTATETAFVDLMAMENEVTVDGEVADEATKAAILDELVKRWNGWTIKDGINVMPNVKPVTTLEATLQSIPDPPAAGTRLFAAAKLGLPMRKDLIHSITLPATAGGISRDQQLAMLRLKAILKLLPAATFRVVGHTDSDGAKKKNESLSLQRAETVAKYLSANGIPSARLQTKGAGSTEPVADNTTPEGRMKNRRVDISLK